eukprot:gene27674-33422_t
MTDFRIPSKFDDLLESAGADYGFNVRDAEYGSYMSHEDLVTKFDEWSDMDIFTSGEGSLLDGDPSSALFWATREFPRLPDALKAAACHYLAGCLPVVKAAGIDPVYFGVLFIINN